MPISSLRSIIVDSPRSLGARARIKRWQAFQATFPGVEDMRILDLGGTVDSWIRSPVRPRQVTVLNLDDQAQHAVANIVGVQGDACNSSGVLSESNIDPDFDLVFSNSLIEHVGGHQRRCELAAEIHKLAPRHWIQTPNRYFPLEPHWLFPGMQFLPTSARVEVAQHWPLTGRHATKRAATAHVLGTELLSAAEMKFYFPNSTIWREHALGMTKSLVAVKV